MPWFIQCCTQGVYYIELQHVHNVLLLLSAVDCCIVKAQPMAMLVTLLEQRLGRQSPTQSCNTVYNLVEGSTHTYQAIEV